MPHMSDPKGAGPRFGEMRVVSTDDLPVELWPDDAKPGDTYEMRLKPTLETYAEMWKRGDLDTVPRES